MRRDDEALNEQDENKKDFRRMFLETWRKPKSNRHKRQLVPDKEILPWNRRELRLGLVSDGRGQGQGVGHSP